MAEAKRTASRNELQDELDRQANFNDVAENLKVAQQDSKDLANSRKAELSALRTILSKEGILADADRKSSQDVNSDLQRFIRLYREKLTQKGIFPKKGFFCFSLEGLRSERSNSEVSRGRSGNR